MTQKLKLQLTRALNEKVAEQIKKQEKNILIDEVVRVLIDEHTHLGFVLEPRSVDELDRHNRKCVLTNALREKYEPYKSTHASVKSITSDLIDEAAKIGIEILPLRKLFVE